MTYSIKMLVADDSQTVQLFFKKIVDRSPMPIEFLSADNGRECMMLLDGDDIDIAFIDVNMPEMSGTEATSRARFKGNRTFITLMSGKADKERLEIARQLKAYEYLVKPFPAETVEAVLKTYQRISVRMKTLIVDDTKTIRKILRRVLERSIFRLSIEEAVDGENALKSLKQGGFDLVFLDYNMPGLDGLETLDRILASEPNAKVIMISAERNEERVGKTLEHGATAFLHKPFFASDVDRALHAALGLKMPELAATQGDAAVRPMLSPTVCPVDPKSDWDEWAVEGDAARADHATDPMKAG